MLKFKPLQRVLSGIALLAALPLAAQAQGKEPVKVGLVSSKSGVFAEQGEEVIRAVRFAVEEANARGGVDGRKVELAEGDDESTPDAGRRVAEKRLSAATSSGACRRCGDGAGPSLGAPAGVWGRYSSSAWVDCVATRTTWAPVTMRTPGVRAATA